MKNLILYFEIYLSGLFCSCAILFRSLTLMGDSELRVIRARCSITSPTQSGVLQTQ
jgi:hypothetical protein